MSRIIKCENGHFYDAEKFKECPHCSKGIGKNKNVVMEGGVSTDLDDVVTVAGPQVLEGFGKKKRSIRIPHVTGRIVKPPEDLEERNRMKDIVAGFKKDIKEHAETHNLDEGGEKTVSLNQLKSGVNPVIGWLVCVSGEEKGNDYRLIRGKNRIGRSLKMDVAVMSDKKITREEHCAVVYDDRSNKSFLVPGNGTLTYYRGEMLRSPQEIFTGDELEIGETRFVFIKFCEEERTWANYE